jgi:Na+-translocating ferredoxin:NAD+ oxidoreductase subunit D
MDQQFLVTAAPHLRSRDTTARLMWTVSATLAPAAAWGVALYGVQAAWVMLASIAAAVLTELAVNLAQGRRTIGDGSAFLTGLLVGMNMPPAVPGFIPVVASVFAIAVVKQTFGGLGRNWMNPALAGRVFVMFCWTSEMTTWTPPRGMALLRLIGASAPDAVSGPTPLAGTATAWLARGGTYWDLFLGNIPGSIGEVSTLLLLIGAAVLFARGIITWAIPVSYLGVFFALTWVLGGLPEGAGFFRGDVIFQAFAGGLALGVFFMATDMVTSPLTPAGQLWYGAGAGALTFLIRFFGGLPEGVSLSIILMNMVVPVINQLTGPKVFGAVREADK